MRSNEIPLSVLARHFRVPTRDLAVDYAGRDLLLRSLITNVSRQGVFIRTEQPLREGTLLTISFRLPGAKRTIEAGAVVRWRVLPGRATATGDVSGMGLEFTEIAPADARAIADFVKTFLTRMRHK